MKRSREPLAWQDAPGDRVCPLCGQSGAELWLHDHLGVWFACGKCRLVFVPPSLRLSRADERAYYATHENAKDDPAYRRFLARLVSPLSQQVPAPARGLDFGCGPAPVLGEMMISMGYEVVSYDPIYFPESTLLSGRYQFISCSEVVEHVHCPFSVMQTLYDCLLPGGTLAIMTGFLPERQAFTHWHYRRDPTHVCLYSEDCFRWIATQFGYRIKFPVANLVMLEK